MRMRRLWRAVGVLVLYGGLLLGMGVAFTQVGSARLGIGQGADPEEAPSSTASVPLALYPDAPPFRAIGDGASHPLAQRYQSLAAAQADYPHATDLSDEIDWAAIQRAMDRATADGALGAKVV